MKTNLALALIGAALISLPAAAQTTRPADTAPRAVQQSAAQGAFFEMKAGQWRATKLTGLPVYNTNNERIGDVNELIVSRDGKVEAVVIGVGGFLGIGEHLAAVPFDQVRWVDQPREQVVGQRDDTTATGSGTTTAPAPGAGGDQADRPAAGTTAADRPATGATALDRPAGTTTTDRGAARDAYRGYPDHAVVAMTKEQLKALPQVRYAR